jgi:phospholipase/carboxylesterase
VSAHHRRGSGWIGLALALLLAAPALAVAATQVNTHYYAIPHMMTCRVHLPADYDPARAYPLLIALHGSGGGIGDYDSLWAGEAKAQCLFVTPEGPYGLPGTPQRPGHSWYLQVRDRRIWALADPLAVEAMLATVAEIRANYRVGAVYILGFSQGASLAYQTAMLHPQTFAGVLAVAGLYPDEAIGRERLALAAPALRVFIAHGDQDAAISPQASEKARALLEAAGCNVTYQRFAAGHAIPAELFRKMLAWVGALAGRND